MSRLKTVELAVASGLMTEETARGAKGRYKDGNKIRFRQLLPQKLGGWILNSIGNDEGNLDPETSFQTETNTVYGSGASSIIDLAASITVADDEEIWLFGDSAVGGLGGRTISDVNAVLGATVFDLSASFSAAQGDAFIIDYPEEYVGGTTITGGGTTGSKMVTVTTGVTTYLKAGSRIEITTDSGPQFTTLAVDLLSGATMITLKDALIDNVATPGPNFFLYAPESIIISTTQGIVIRFLGQAVAAATLMQITKPLPADADGLDVDVRPFQETMADGAQTGTTVNIDPNTTFAITSVATFPDGMVIAPAVLALTETCFLGFARALHDWVSLDDQKWLAIGTDTKLYLVNNDTLFDITPLRSNGTLVDPFDTDATGAFDPSGGGDRSFVQVTHAGHGGQVGNFVRFTGATDVGGVPMNGEFTIASVTDSDMYVVQATVGALSTATGGGAVSFEYDIDVGAAGNITVQGYGTGGYGLGGYGQGDPAGGILETLRIWSLDNFGEDLLASPNGGSLYHWDRTTGTASRAVVVPEAPATMQRMLVSPEERHVVAFGAGTGSQASPGDPDKLFTRWSDSESFNSWIPTSVNLAGDLRLDVGSEIITAIESRGDVITFTDQSLHALQFIGGDLVFTFRHLGQSVTVIGANTAIDVNGIVMFMGEDDFLMYDGVLRVMNCDVRNQVFDNINTAQGQKSFAAVNKLFTEVWWFYPTAVSETNNRYVKYNYKDQVWDFGTIDRTAFHDSSAFLGKPYGTLAGKLYQHETGVDESDAEGTLVPMVSFIETWDMELGDGEYLMHVGEMIPDFEILVGSIDLTLKGRGYPARAEISSAAFTVTSLTEKVDLRFRSRQISFRIDSDALSDDWRMSAWRAGARPHGRRGG